MVQFVTQQLGFGSGHDVNTDFFSCFGQASEDSRRRYYETFKRSLYGQLDSVRLGGLGTVFPIVPINASTLNICLCGQERPP